MKEAPKQKTETSQKRGVSENRKQKGTESISVSCKRFSISNIQQPTCNAKTDPKQKTETPPLKGGGVSVSGASAFQGEGRPQDRQYHGGPESPDLTGASHRSEDTDALMGGHKREQKVQDDGGVNTGGAR